MWRSQPAGHDPCEWLRHHSSGLLSLAVTGCRCWATLLTAPPRARCVQQGAWYGGAWRHAAARGLHEQPVPPNAADHGNAGLPRSLHAGKLRRHVHTLLGSVLRARMCAACLPAPIFPPARLRVLIYFISLCIVVYCQRIRFRTSHPAALCSAVGCNLPANAC